MIMTVYRCFLLAVTLFMCNAVVQAANPPAMVVKVQNQAALQRNGDQIPLKNGTALRSGDIITTGNKARVLIRFFDDSIGRLGANTKISLNELLPPVDKETGVSGFLELSAGAFRYTSDTPAKRNLQVKVGKSITMGIRGTDVFAYVWKKKSEDVVCLFEGKIAVSGGGTNAVLDEHGEFFMVPFGGKAKEIGIIDPDLMRQWMENTELMEPYEPLPGTE